MTPIVLSRSKKELVIETIRSPILNRELTSGTRLAIEDLAKRLGVSPIPVREALQTDIFSTTCLRAGCGRRNGSIGRF